MFIDPNARERVVHPEDIDKPESEQRVITLRKQLTRDQRARIRDAAVKVELSGADSQNSTFSVGTFTKVLLDEYMTGWSGPGLPAYEKALLVNLDDEDPLVQAASSMAAQMWQKAKADPKG